MTYQTPNVCKFCYESFDPLGECTCKGNICPHMRTRPSNNLSFGQFVMRVQKCEIIEKFYRFFSYELPLFLDYLYLRIVVSTFEHQTGGLEKVPRDTNESIWTYLTVMTCMCPVHDSISQYFIGSRNFQISMLLSYR